MACVALRPTSSYETVLLLLQRGELRGVRAGKHWRIPASEVRRWLAGGVAA